MSDIKFRSWNKVNKTMYDNSIYNCKDSFDMQLKHPQIYEVMQYIGLEDKNGRKIYEGDIVKTKEHIGQIIYSKGVFFIDVKGDFYLPIYNVSEFMEVIGNIYENPELLER